MPGSNIEKFVSDIFLLQEVDPQMRNINCDQMSLNEIAKKRQKIKSILESV